MDKCGDILFKLLKLGVLGKLWKISLTSKFSEPLLKTLKIPLVSISVAELLANALSSRSSDCLDEFHKILAVKNLVSLCVNDLTLLVHNIVVIKDVLTHCKIDFLNLALGALDKLGNNLCLNWHIVWKLIALHHCCNAIHAISTKAAHQIIFKRKVELGLTRVSLTTRTTTKLIVNTTTLMTLGTNNAQTTRSGYCLTLSSADFLCFFARSFFLLLSSLSWLNSLVTKDIFSHDIWVATQKNIGTTTCHVGCNSNCTLTASLSNNLRLTLMELSVQNVMFNAAFRQNARNTLGVVNGNGTNKYWLTILMTLFNVSYDSLKLSINSTIDQVIEVFTLYRTIRWNNLNRNVINLTELCVLGHCSTGHTGELVVHEEVVLEGDSCQSLVFFTYLNILFCLNCLVKTLRITTAFHDTTSKLINNLNFAVNDNVLLVTMEHILSLQRLLKMID